MNQQVLHPPPPPKKIIKNRAMARATTERKWRELLTEFNKLKGSKSHSTNCMDDVTASEQMANIFFG